MSKVDYQVLREAAEQATPDEWVAFISTDTGTYAVHTPGDERCEDIIKWTGFDGQKNAENNARHVAAFNPKVALELLGEIKCLEDTNIDAMCRIAELETNRAALVAENELARKAVQAFCDVVGDNTEVICEEVGRDGVLVILEAMKATGNMPATDAFLAEVRAQGVEMAMEHMQSSGSLTFGDCYISLNEFAAQLRKGGNQ
ncbi:ead/Ea22-like family protein [Escherichia coli]|uniref:ead/Ea22-like family protein n=1 Tax=Escherichia coli TaxID=562 RepID=UPI002594B451|nr:ead/Ea22-like family protein [Escherichia coli]WJK05582.1 ead/Ea22-like family protein [Escherichia coli]HAX2161037.1 ead/Ea22-like family protein [Escherichia coli]